ncbi:MAG TPA: YtxH domain-containing protein [Thermoanaerobaculia bacterium]|nr:YtxH domain-containing protein [Thermoanaerobaculia bacterium]
MFESRKRAKIRQAAWVAAAFALGAIAGAAVALAYAPKKGRDLRRQVMKNVDSLTEKAVEQATHLSEGIRELKGKIRAA